MNLFISMSHLIQLRYKNWTDLLLEQTKKMVKTFYKITSIWHLRPRWNKLHENSKRNEGLFSCWRSWFLHCKLFLKSACRTQTPSKAEPDTYLHLQGWRWQVHDLGGNKFSYLEKKRDWRFPIRRLWTDAPTEKLLSLRPHGLHHPLDHQLPINMTDINTRRRVWRVCSGGRLVITIRLNVVSDSGMRPTL